MPLDTTLALSICTFDLSQVGNEVVCVEYAQEKQETRACATMIPSSTPCARRSSWIWRRSSRSAKRRSLTTDWVTRRAQKTSF